MNGRSVAAVTFVLLFVLSAAPLPVRADSGAFVLLTEYENRAYYPGELFNLTIYTYAHGERVDPDGPPLVTVGAYTGGPIRELPVRVTGVGSFEVNYTVLASDTDSWGTVSLSLQATLGRSSDIDTDYDSASASVYVSTVVGAGYYYAEGLTFTGRLLETSDMPVRPGTRVTFSVNVTDNGTPADPAGLRFQLSSYSQQGASQDVVNATQERQGPGRYLVYCAIPKARQSETFELHAILPDSPSISYTGAYLDLDFYNVLYHELKRNGTRVDYELLVSDRGGNPVKAAGIELTLTPWGGVVAPVTTDLGRTDGNGRVRGFIDFGWSVAAVAVGGWANSSRYSQHFGGTVYLPGEYSPLPPSYASDFYVEEIAYDEPPSPGLTLNITYRASDQKQPLRSTPVDCYIETSRLVRPSWTLTELNVSGTTVMTDDSGDFNLTLSFPPGIESQIEVLFNAPTDFSYPDSSGHQTGDGLSYSTSTDDLYATFDDRSASWVNVTSTKAEPGNDLKVRVSAPGGGLQSVYESWSFTNQDSQTEYPAWQVWNSFSSFLNETAPGSGAFQGRMPLPRNLKPGLNITLQLSLTNSSGDRTQYDIELTVRAVAVPAAQVDMCCISSIFVVNAMLIGLLFFNYLAARRKPGHRDLEELGPDERIDEVLRSSGGGQPGLTLPIKVEMAQGEDCTVCGRRIARGNLALRCVCGGRFHEHCTGTGTKCPSCGREWKKS